MRTKIFKNSCNGGTVPTVTTAPFLKQKCNDMSCIRNLGTGNYLPEDRHVFMYTTVEAKTPNTFGFIIEKKYINSKTIEVLERDICAFLAGFCNIYQS